MVKSSHISSQDRSVETNPRMEPSVVRVRIILNRIVGMQLVLPRMALL